jgi:hypothetical protein
MSNQCEFLGVPLRCLDLTCILYIWNTAQNSLAYVHLTISVFFSELVQNFKLYQSGGKTHKMHLNVGHDGSMIQLVAGLRLILQQHSE